MVEVVNGNSQGNTNLLYLHPSVMSTVSNNQITLDTANGNVKMFCPILSERGKDNKIQYITNAKEFLFHYGKPDLKKYGQASYNIINFLNAGGEAYVLRVLPENAGYSHSFLNIQTKKGKKKVKDINGNLVDIDDITMRPVIAYSNVNNSSEQLLSSELLRDRTREKTIDGFINHLLFLIYPHGRGKAYNDLGFRLTLNQSFDEIYDFRVYNFEVVQFDENNTANMIEGPFYVSLSPDAISSSNESMFIESVINKYSKYLRCKFNEDEFDRLGEIINPTVDPANLDFLTGKTRMFKGTPQTFFSEVTKQYEDVHIALQRYDKNGQPLFLGGSLANNFIDPKNKIEQSVLLIDNISRNKIYNNSIKSVENIKKALTHIRGNTFRILVEGLLKSQDKSNISEGQIKTYIDRLEKESTELSTVLKEYEADKSDYKFQKVYIANNKIEKTITEITNTASEINDYCSIMNDSRVLNLISSIDTIYNKLNIKEIINIRSISKKDKLNDLENILISSKASYVEDQILDLSLVASDLKTVMDYVSSLAVENNAPSNILDAINTAISTYNTAYENIVLIKDPYTDDESKNKLLSATFIGLEKVIESALSIINDTVLYVQMNINNSIVKKILPDIYSKLVSLYSDCIDYVEKVSKTNDKERLVRDIKDLIDKTSSRSTILKSIMYINQLQDFDNPIRLTSGSDGDLESKDVKLRTNTTTNLFIQAYKGLIDEDILNSKLIPAKILLDFNSPVEVKNAMTMLTRDIRKDIFAFIDTGIRYTPVDDIKWREEEFRASSELMALFSQGFVVYDEFNGRDIKVTMSYFLAYKIPSQAREYGLHFPMAGPRRGTIDGFKSISYVPNENYKEQLFIRQINYVEADPKRTMIGSQLTATSKNTPLSRINNVLTLLDIKKDVETLSENYKFEFEDSQTMMTYQYDLNNFLSKYISNRSCEELKATVFASDYDKSQHILRVNIVIKFTGTIERIIINHEIVR